MKSLTPHLTQIGDFCTKWGILELALFGSIIRDDAGTVGDVDVLVTIPESTPLTLHDWVAMKDELTSLFGREVDLVSKTGLRNPFRRHEILRTRKVIYEAHTQ